MSDQPLYPPRQGGDLPASTPPAGIPSYAPPLTPDPVFSAGLDPNAAPLDNEQEGGSDSTVDVAKSQAADVAGGAKDAAADVAGTAKEQVQEVAAEAKNQVKNVMGQARSELTEQAQTQQKKVAAGLSSLADQLSAMAAGSDQPGVATDVAQQAADRAQEFAGWLDNRDPQGVLEDVRAFARRKPGVFLVAALGAGVLAGRLARGLSADPGPSQSSTAQAARIPDSAPSAVADGGRHEQLLPGSGEASGTHWDSPAAATSWDRPGSTP